MSNIFIGPYRQTDAVGIQSRLYLQDFCSHLPDVVSRPIYISDNGKYLSSTVDSETIRGDTRNPSLVIQHLPISYLVHELPSTTKKIAIPILGDQNLSSKKEKELLEKFDLVLYDDQIMYNSYKTSNARFIKPSIPSQVTNTDKKFNLGIHNHNIKFYLIADFETNQDAIEKTMLSFMSMLGTHRRISLILFLSAKDTSFVQSLENRIKGLYKVFGIKNDNIDIGIVAIDSSEESVLIAHNTGDIFLNINDNPRISLNYWMAELFKKPIIDLSEVMMFTEYFKNGQYSEGKFLTICQNYLEINMEKIISNKETRSRDFYSLAKSIKDTI